MAKIHSLMDIGKRTMMNSQTALQTVAHNIANKTTEGYSRQRVDTVTAEPITEGRNRIGMGAKAASISRTSNPFLDKQVQTETGILAFHEGQADTMGRVEQIFNEQMNKGLNQYMTDFFNAYRELSNSPESNAVRTLVSESAKALTQDFHRVDKQLEQVQKEVDMQVKQSVSEINQMTKELASLNEKIASIENQGTPANDERDRREVVLKHLHEKIDIKVAEGNGGMLTVSTAGNAILVSDSDAIELTIQHHPDTHRLQIYYRPLAQSTPFDITDRIKGGRLGGNLEIRDKLVPDLREKMDLLATTLANDVNAAHTRGFDKVGRQGKEFFQIGKGESGAASNIKFNEDLQNDVSKIATAASPGAPGDNTVANVISMIQYKKNLEGGTLDDFYNTQVGQVGIIANRAVKSKETQQNILNQVNTMRESVSGVSLDEEATKMIEFQKAFDASARVIKVADEMFDTILNLKRL